MALDTDEKAISNYNNGNGKANPAKTAHIQELQQLAQEAIFAEDYDKASKLYYEIYTLDQEDILSKYLYDLSFQLIPLTQEEKQIYSKKDTASPEYMEIDKIVKRREKRSIEVCCLLAEYGLDQKIDCQAEKQPIILHLIQLIYNKYQLSHDVQPIHKAFAPHLETNADVRRLATQLSDNHMKALDRACQQGLEAAKQDPDILLIQFIRDKLTACLEQAQMLQGFYPDILVPESIKQAEEWCNREDIRNLKTSSIIRSMADQMIQQKKEEMARAAKESEERAKKPLFSNYELWGILLVLLTLYYFLA